MTDKNLNKVLVEVCVDSVESAIAAEQGGAVRVELCAGLSAGGITPSAGMIASVRKHLRGMLHVMIRPRGGDFCYSELEFEIMQRDILAAREFGADGVVFGILNPDRTVDVARTRELVELAKPLNVTFHRAFDVVADPFRAMEEIIGLGIERILTSGQAATAAEGSGLISQMVQKAAGRIIIMPASGINLNNICNIIECTGVKEIHVGSAVSTPVDHQNTGMFNFSRTIVDAAKVRKLTDAVSVNRVTA